MLLFKQGNPFSRVTKRTVINRSLGICFKTIIIKELLITMLFKIFYPPDALKIILKASSQKYHVIHFHGNKDIKIVHKAIVLNAHYNVIILSILRHSSCTTSPLTASSFRHISNMGFKSEAPGDNRKAAMFVAANWTAPVQVQRYGSSILPRGQLMFTQNKCLLANSQNIRLFPQFFRNACTFLTVLPLRSSETAVLSGRPRVTGAV